jgi:tRNA(Ile2)-agmatinylcytidine synthase
MKNILYVGIDDTDSSEGMCTTYIGALVMDELKHYGFQLKGHPRLIRLNPFAPFKTRGNGAISFNLSLNSGKDAKKAKKLILNRVENLSELQHKNTNPGVVFYDGIITPELETYSMTTVQKIVTIENAQKLAVQVGAQFHKFKNGRGIIGALAAIGYPLEDRTYELLAYRIPENYGKKRKINYKSVLEMNQKTYPQTFDNLDEDEDYIAIEPHTPCPILYGIRGETPEAVIKAHGILKTCETIERIVVYATNQHTDNHLLKIDHISQMDKCKCYIAQGFVENSPKTIEGGHVIFNLKDDSGSIDCAAYEPTKGFRDVVKNLKDGDLLKVYGGIGNKGSLNLEKIHVLKLAKVYESRNPICECGKRMKSAGKNKGYKCMNCGFKLRYGTKNLIEVKRNIKKGFYEVPPAARRHLSKPLIRK